MTDLRSRRRMATAAGVSLLLHLAVLGALSLIGPHFAAEDTVGNESDDSRMTIHALQDGPDAQDPRGSARPSSARTPSANAPSPDPPTEHESPEPTAAPPGSDRPSSANAPSPDTPTEHESSNFTAAPPGSDRPSPAPTPSSDPTATEPASSRASPDTPPSSDPSRRVTGHTTSLPERESKPDPEPEERRSAQIASRESESAIRTAEPSAPPAPGGAARPLPDSAAAPDNATPPAPDNAAPPFPGDAAPRRSRSTGERPARQNTQDSGVSRSELVRALYDELEEAFHYPAIARRRALEGSVELLVEVAVDGELRSITVEQSSGSRILDEAATETVTRLFPRSRAPRSAHQVRLRVRYKLN